MRQFLVMGGTAMDDVPLALLSTHEEARKFAESVEEKQVLAAVRDTLHRDASYASVIFIVPFADGKPEPFELVKDFTVEPTIV